MCVPVRNHKAVKLLPPYKNKGCPAKRCGPAWSIWWSENFILVLVFVQYVLYDSLSLSGDILFSSWSCVRWYTAIGVLTFYLHQFIFNFPTPISCLFVGELDQWRDLICETNGTVFWEVHGAIRLINWTRVDIEISYPETKKIGIVVFVRRHYVGRHTCPAVKKKLTPRTGLQWMPVTWPGVWSVAPNRLMGRVWPPE